ncbi:MAG: diaminopimelate decarboxylase family protein [Candidatus Syntropharchaeia archaeon]
MKSLDIENVAKEHSTPFYLIDPESARESFFRIRKLFPGNTIIAYATKANYSPSIIKLFSDLGLHFDTFTAGEVKHLLNCGVDAEKIMYTSVTETKGEFEFVLSRGVRFFVIGSLNGLYNLKEVTEREKIDVDILLRVQPIKHVKAVTSTSGIKSKFGVLFDEGKDSVRNILPKIREHLNFMGFHFHLGTQVADPEFYVKAIDRVLEYAQKNEIDIKILDIGGGYPFQYHEEVPPIKKFGEAVSKSIDAWRRVLDDFKLIIEPGRYLVAGSAVLVTRVANIKELYGRKIIILDAGDDMVMVKRHHVEPKIRVLSSSEEKEKYIIAGNLCHSADWIVEKPIALPEVKPGDLIVFENVGAYIMNHNLPYGLRRKPKALVIREGKRVEEEHPFDIVCRLYPS